MPATQASDKEKTLSPSEAKPCPFCGIQPVIRSWHGGEPTKKLISCANEQCFVVPMVTGETRLEALEHWNRRAA